MDKNRLSFTVAGKEIILETGKIAKQANGAVMLRSGDTIILATACASRDPLPDIDFFPLRVDYQEKFSSAGKTQGGFIKRDGKLSERETLVCRLIDRPIRPLFADGYHHEVQLLTYVLSYDSAHPPEPLAIIASSAALVISDIPFPKPLAAVRMGMINGNFVVNPTIQEQTQSTLDLVLAGTEDGILMIEGYCDFLPEETVIRAIEEGHGYIKEICQKLSDWQNIAGKDKAKVELVLPSDELVNEVEHMFGKRFEEAFAIKDKKIRGEALHQINLDAKAHFFPADGSSKHTPALLNQAVHIISSKLLRKIAFTLKKRADGRGMSDIRPISVETALLPRTHGSALFTRGETQSLAVCTLGGETMGQRYEDLEGDKIRRFYLQYSFPPFSVGEVGRVGPPGRREVGHGKLAERALEAIIPKANDAFPYTIRLESNITECNGSSSMASVCGCCLAMMDAGVPIKRPVAGIAMGLMLQGDNFLILSDIIGLEDSHGDMDFKITGDNEGITAFQMDIKVEGITPDIMRAALMQAKEGRIHILSKMLSACPTSRSDLSPYAPRIESFSVKQSKIGTIIGPGGKMIRSIIDETGVAIDINDEGIVNLSSNNAEQLAKARKIILDLVTEVEVGKTYKGIVTSVQPYGAFISLPGGSKDGLCHISELSLQRVNSVEEVVKQGQEIEVLVKEINDAGQIKLSRKALLKQ